MNCVEIVRTAKGCGFMVARAVDESSTTTGDLPGESIMMCCQCGHDGSGRREAASLHRG